MSKAFFCAMLSCLVVSWFVDGSALGWLTIAFGVASIWSSRKGY